MRSQICWVGSNGEKTVENHMRHTPCGNKWGPLSPTRAIDQSAHPRDSPSRGNLFGCVLDPRVDHASAQDIAPAATARQDHPLARQGMEEGVPVHESGTENRRWARIEWICRFITLPMMDGDGW